jgi:hypothetical protein
MLDPLILNRDLVKANARQAFAAGELGFQHGIFHGEGCRYEYEHDTRVVCGIGASVPHNYARIFDERDCMNVRDHIRGVTVFAEDTTIRELIDIGAVKTDDAPFLVELQNAHDDLCSDEPNADALDKFMTLIAP